MPWQSEMWKFQDEANNFQLWTCWGLQQAMNSKAPPKQRCGRDLGWFGPNFDTTNSGFVQTWLPFHSPLCQVRISYDGNARLTETARAVSCPPKDGWSSGWLPGSTKYYGILPGRAAAINIFKSTQTTLWEYKVRQSTKSGYCPF